MEEQNGVQRQSNSAHDPATPSLAPSSSSSWPRQHTSWESSTSESSSTTSYPTACSVITPKGKEGRLKFEYDGRTIYEWEQTLEDVSIFVTPPSGVKASMLRCTIASSHLTLGLKEAGHPFIDEATGGSVKAAESFWTLEDGELHVLLQKAKKGEVWPSALAGRGSLDPVTSESVRKQLMLERFQEENPGFDFSNAEFNGAVPDPETFLGGVKYN
ncbi:CS-like domain protein [Nannochloropsis gaditana]|uniref:CS-like domain protein n=1 Tax=Nannochloropsis gaditana TaxID=72520 RepID=W7TSS7_9STRA|nr:CS-like domain protein [Nannochloropsis gaditana]